MKKFLKIGAAAAAMCLAAGFFASCGGEDSDDVHPVVATTKTALKKAISNASDGATIVLGNCTLEANDSYTVTQENVTIKDGDVNGATFVIEGKGVTLSNLKNIDTVIVDAKVGDGDFTMVNCPGTKVVVVNGGGSNSVHISKTGIEKLSVNKADVRVLLEEAATVAKAYVLKNCETASKNVENTITACVVANDVESLTLNGAATIATLVSEATIAPANFSITIKNDLEGVATETTFTVSAADEIVKSAAGQSLTNVETVSDKSSLTEELSASKNEATLAGLVGFWVMEGTGNGYYAKNTTNIYEATKVNDVWYCNNDAPYELSIGESGELVLTRDGNPITCTIEQDGTLKTGGTNSTLRKQESIPNMLDIKYMPKPTVPTLPEVTLNQPTLPTSVGDNEVSGRRLVSQQYLMTFEFGDDGTTLTRIQADKNVTCEFNYSYNSTNKLIYAIPKKIDGMTFEECCSDIEDSIEDEFEGMIEKEYEYATEEDYTGDKEAFREKYIKELLEETGCSSVEELKALQANAEKLNVKDEFEKLWIYEYTLDATDEKIISTLEEKCDLSLQDWRTLKDFEYTNADSSTQPATIEITLKNCLFHKDGYTLKYNYQEATATTITCRFKDFEDVGQGVTPEQPEPTIIFTCTVNNNKLTFTKDNVEYPLEFYGTTFTNTASSSSQ